MKYIARAVLLVIYALSLGLALLGGLLRTTRARSDRILVCVTIDNPNWFRAHIEPLVASSASEVLVVCDEPVREMPGLRYCCPPAWQQRWLSRAGAKAVTSFVAAQRYKPGLVMGYHIMPCGIIALVVGRLLGTYTAYQATSGTTELSGGGHAAENKVLRALETPSDVVERLALAIVRQFDRVFVRGTTVREFLLARGVGAEISLLTGAITTDPMKISAERDIDVVFVGRLAPVKNVPMLLRATAALPGMVKVVIVGDGPQRQELQSLAMELGIAEQVEFAGQLDDVSSMLGRARIFALTSVSESVSIAMLEAMSMGAVPVVTDVGDLRDFVLNGDTGYLVQSDDAGAMCDAIWRLLGDREALDRCSEAAREMVTRKCTVQRIAASWDSQLESMKAQ